jgi:hypothetical protein
LRQNCGPSALRQLAFPEEDRCNVNPDDIKACFDCCKTPVATTPSPFVSNIDETRVGARKKQQPPSVMVSAQTGPGQIAVPKTRDDSRLTLWTVISAFANSTLPFFLSKNNTLEKKRLADFEMLD